MMWETSGATKIRRYEEKEINYHQNTLFTTNQKTFYQELDNIVVTFQIKPLTLNNLLNFGAIFGRKLEILTKIFHGERKVE